MSRVPILALALALSGCVVAHVRSDGSVTAWALGNARVERCVVPQGLGGREPECVVVTGGSLSAQARAVLQGITGLLGLGVHQAR